MPYLLSPFICQLFPSLQPEQKLQPLEQPLPSAAVPVALHILHVHVHLSRHGRLLVVVLFLGRRRGVRRGGQSPRGIGDGTRSTRLEGGRNGLGMRLGGVGDIRRGRLDGGPTVQKRQKEKKWIRPQAGMHLLTMVQTKGISVYPPPFHLYLIYSVVMTEQLQQPGQGYETIPVFASDEPPPPPADPLNPGAGIPLLGRAVGVVDEFDRE